MAAGVGAPMHPISKGSPQSSSYGGGSCAPLLSLNALRCLAGLGKSSPPGPAAMGGGTWQPRSLPRLADVLRPQLVPALPSLGGLGRSRPASCHGERPRVDGASPRRRQKLANLQAVIAQGHVAPPALPWGVAGPGVGAQGSFPSSLRRDGTAPGETLAGTPPPPAACTLFVHNFFMMMVIIYKTQTLPPPTPSPGCPGW